MIRKHVKKKIKEKAVFIDFPEFIKKSKQLFWLVFFMLHGLSKTSSFSSKFIHSKQFANVRFSSSAGESRSVILFEKVNDYVILHHKEKALYD